MSSNVCCCDGYDEDDLEEHLEDVSIVECYCGENCCRNCLRSCVNCDFECSHHHLEQFDELKECSENGCSRISCCSPHLMDCLFCQKSFCNEHIKEFQDPENDGENYNCDTCAIGNVAECFSCDSLFRIDNLRQCTECGEHFCPDHIDADEELGRCLCYTDIKVITHRMGGNNFDIQQLVVSIPLMDERTVNAEKHQKLQELEASKSFSDLEYCAVSMNMSGGANAGAVRMPERRRVLLGSVFAALTPDLIMGQEAPWVISNVAEQIQYNLPDHEYGVSGDKDSFIMWKLSRFRRTVEITNCDVRNFGNEILNSGVQQNMIEHLHNALNDQRVLRGDNFDPLSRLCEILSSRIAMVVLQTIQTSNHFLVVSVHGHSTNLRGANNDVLRSYFRCIIAYIRAVQNSLGLQIGLIGGDFNLNLDTLFDWNEADFGYFMPTHIHSNRREGREIDFILTSDYSLMRGYVKAANLAPLPEMNTKFGAIPGVREWALLPFATELDGDDSTSCWEGENWKCLSKAIEANGEQDIVHRVAIESLLDHDPMTAFISL